MIIVVTFQEWCINNNRKDLLERWDYKLNVVGPSEISSSNSKCFYFLCPERKHNSKKIIISNITGKSRINLAHLCHECLSFHDMCIKENKIEILDLWDYEKNIISPKQVPSQSNNNYWFKCPRRIHDSHQYKLSNIFNRNRVTCSVCNSIGQYIIDKYGLEKLYSYWNKEENNKTGLNPFEVYFGSRTKVAINCQEKEYHGVYWVKAEHFCTEDVRCPYCGYKRLHMNDSLAIVYPEVLGIWSSKNKKSPYEYFPQSSQKVWWKCEHGKHKDYYRVISNSYMYDYRCPECMREEKVSVLHIKIKKYINRLFDKISYEHDCSFIPINPKTKSNMPFDFEIPGIRLLIECQGEQHSELLNENSMFLNDLTPQQYLRKRQLYDRYKKYRAHLAGYNYLAISYWTEKNDEYKKLIDDTVAKIQSGQHVNTKIA